MVSWDVVGLGAVSVDFVGEPRDWPPALGSKSQLKSLEVCDGGLVGTALCAASRLGGRAAYVGKLGDSEFAERALRALLAEGVLTGYVLRASGAEPHLAMVISTRHERTILYSRDNVRYPLPEEYSDLSWLDRTRTFLFDAGSGEAGIAFAREARRRGAQTVLDAERLTPSIEESLVAADHIVVPEDFARQAAGAEGLEDAAAAIRSRESQVVVITRGENGCLVLEGNEVSLLPAFEVEVVDTTGCGDVFHGAYALAVGQGDSVREACVFASAAAALSARKPGGRAGIPRRGELLAFLRSLEK